LHSFLDSCALFQSVDINRHRFDEEDH
jgi:hypothetical protein